MQPDITNSAEMMNCADDGKNTGCGPAAPEHFNYGDERHNEGTDTATQNKDLQQGIETDDTVGIP